MPARRRCSTALRALRGSYPEPVFAVLLLRADERRLAGAIDALGRYRRAEALPAIVVALGDDLARPAAEAAIRAFGASAWPHLVEAANQRALEGDAETESSRRRRRSALTLLLETGGSGMVPPTTRRQLVHDDDPAIAVLGCRLALECGDDEEKRSAVQRLIELLPSVRWSLR